MTVNDDSLAFEVNSNTPAIRFLASLSDGRTVIQDDRVDTRHAWSRLSEWMKNNPDISITGLRIQGPGGIAITMPANQSGYFLGYKQSAVWTGPQANYAGIGYYDGQTVVVSWYRQPKFDNAQSEERTTGNAGFFLISNP